MGRGALVKHNKSVKHIKNVEELSSASARTLLSWTRPVTKKVNVIQMLTVSTPQ